MAICSTLLYSMSVFTWCSGSPLGGVSATTYFPDHEVAILIDPTALREIKKTPAKPRPNQNGSTMTHFWAATRRLRNADVVCLHPKWKELKSSVMSVFASAPCGTLNPPPKSPSDWPRLLLTPLRGPAEGGRDGYENLGANHGRPPHQRRPVGKLQSRCCSEQGWENRAWSISTGLEENRHICINVKVLCYVKKKIKKKFCHVTHHKTT